MSKTTKEAKTTKATQAKKPTEEKLLSAKDLAAMAKVKPTVLRRCLRKSFASRISTAKNGAGLKVYQIKANDPIVKEILAKLKGNGSKPTTPVKTKAEKPASEPVKGKASGKGKKQAKVGKPTPEAVFQSTADKQQAETPSEESPSVSPPFTEGEATEEGEGDEPSPESLNHIEAFDAIYGGKDSREKMEKIVAQAHSESQFNYKGYQFTVHKDYTVTVINPGNSISHHNSLANALHQRGFSFRQLEKEGVLPKELAEVKWGKVYRLKNRSGTGWS